MQETQVKSEKPDNDQATSVCDIMKNNTSKIIKKLELQIPTTIQLYSDFYTSYLHALDDLFGTCYLSEKEFLDKMGFDEKSLQNFKSASDNITKNIEHQIDIMNNMQRSFLEMRTQWMKMYEQQAHLMMDSYSKFFSKPTLI